MADDTRPPGKTPSVPTVPTPDGAKLDRASIERVLARAAELQTSSGEVPDQISENQLIEAGREVGLSTQHLRQALAEERTRSLVPGAERGPGALIFGPAQVFASRALAGN